MRLGKSTRCCHFRSKAGILKTLLAEPAAAYARLEELASGTVPAGELLCSYLEVTVNSRELPAEAANAFLSLRGRRRAPRHLPEGWLLAPHDGTRQCLL